MTVPFKVSCLLCVLLCAGAVPAQTKQRQTAAPTKQTPTPESRRPVLPDIRNDPDVKDADVAIIANITADELRFDFVPNPSVEFLGKDKTRTIWQAERFNLPDKIEPGVTYRNIGIRLKITSRLADIERIVAEALGEIPISSEEQRSNVKTNTSSVESNAGTVPGPPSQPVKTKAGPHE